MSRSHFPMFWATVAIAGALFAGPGVSAATTIQTTLTVPQSPQRVWMVLTDLAAYPRWNTFMTRASGRLSPGDTVTVELHPQSGGPLTVRAKLLKVQPNAELRWIGKFGAGGLFDGEHFWLLSATPTGGTQLVHGETYRGMLVGVVKPTRFQEDFERMNRDMAAELAREDGAAPLHAP